MMAHPAFQGYQARWVQEVFQVPGDLVVCQDHLAHLMVWDILLPACLPMVMVTHPLSHTGLTTPSEHQLLEFHPAENRKYFFFFIFIFLPIHVIISRDEFI